MREGKRGGRVRAHWDCVRLSQNPTWEAGKSPRNSADAAPAPGLLGAPGAQTTAAGGTVHAGSAAARVCCPRERSALRQPRGAPRGFHRTRQQARRPGAAPLFGPRSQGPGGAGQLPPSRLGVLPRGRLFRTRVSPPTDRARRGAVTSGASEGLTLGTACKLADPRLRFPAGSYIILSHSSREVCKPQHTGGLCKREEKPQSIYTFIYNEIMV